MISILSDTPFLVIVLVLCVVTYMIAKPGKPEKIRFLGFLLLTIVTAGVFLFDNSFNPNPYAGLVFYVFDFYIFTPVSLALSLTAIYKSNKHLKHYPSKSSNLLRVNAWFLAIFSSINFLFLMLTEEMGILFLLPLFGISSIIQFIVGELERKRVRKLQQQKNEGLPIPDSVSNEGDIDENCPGDT